MKIINGQKIAAKILADLKKEIKIKKLKPVLALILVGDNPASRLYIRLKEKAGQEVGLKVKKHILSNKVSEKAILKIIASFNQDPKVNGILVQLPLPRTFSRQEKDRERAPAQKGCGALPKRLSADRIIKEIDPAKDVDGFVRRSHFEPPFILAIWQALKATKEDLKNKKIVALVNSNIFGQAVSSFLRNKGLKVDYVLAKSQGLKNKIRQADVLITALGQPNSIKGSMIKKGAILIDGGIAKSRGKVIGDIDFKSVSQKAKWLSPVPGGLGPMTVAFLLKNVVLATKL